MGLLRNDLQREIREEGDYRQERPALTTSDFYVQSTLIQCAAGSKRKTALDLVPASKRIVGEKSLQTIQLNRRFPLPSAPG